MESSVVVVAMRSGIRFSEIVGDFFSVTCSSIAEGVSAAPSALVGDGGIGGNVF